MSDHPQTTERNSHGGSSRSLRLTLVLLVLVSFLPLGLGVLTMLPQVRDAVRRGEAPAAWHRLLAAIPGRHDLGGDSSAPAATAADHAGPPTIPSAVPDKVEANQIAYGDRLKISFFENSNIASDGSASGPDQPLATAFLRMDLSAEYAVDGAGAIDIPRLGQVAAAGKTVGGLQSVLAAIFKHEFGRTSEVHIAIVSRQPVYVIGNVRTTGVVKYAPGMIVLQALTNAGGSASGVADTSEQIERIRETERLHQAEDSLAQLRVKQARLLALREKTEHIASPASIHSHLDAKRLQEILASATVTLNLERRRHRRQLELADQRVHIAKLQVETEKSRINNIKELANQKRKVLRELTDIAARGSVSQFRLIEMHAEVLEVEAREKDLQVALAQAQQNLLENMSAKARLEFDNALRIQHELAATAQGIEDGKRSIASIQAVVQVLQDDPASESSGNLAFRITRKVDGRFKAIPATEMTALMPGDVLQVGSRGSADLALSRSTNKPQSLKN